MGAASSTTLSQQLLWQLPYHVSPRTGEAFGLEGLGQTYLSLDVDGRVVRLDSFSKFLAPGMRLGWVTAHPDMLQKICFALHASTMGPCSCTQVQHLSLPAVLHALKPLLLSLHTLPCCMLVLLLCHIVSCGGNVFISAVC